MGFVLLLVAGGLALTWAIVDAFDDDDDDGTDAADAEPAGLIAGTSSPDILEGTEGDDILQGKGGNDSVTGGAGDDIAFGGSGEDSVSGDAGNDLVLGRTADDLLSGGTGDDWVEGGAGFDTVAGDDGADIVIGGEGADRLAGGEGDDILVGGDLLSRELTLDELIALRAGVQSGDGLEPPEDVTLAVRSDSLIDQFDGGAGNDILFVDRGDAAAGGEGADEFWLLDTPADGDVTQITDFAPGEDVLFLVLEQGAPEPVLDLVDQPDGSQVLQADGEPVATIAGSGGATLADIALYERGSLPGFVV